MDTVYLNRNNTIDKAIRVDGGSYISAPYPLDATSKVRLLLIDKDGTETALQSDDAQPYVSTEHTREKDGYTIRVVTIALGLRDPPLAEGQYDAILSIFSAQYPQGLVVGEFKIQVRPA